MSMVWWHRTTGYWFPPRFIVYSTPGTNSVSYQVFLDQAQLVTVKHLLHFLHILNGSTVIDIAVQHHIFAIQS